MKKLFLTVSTVFLSLTSVLPVVAFNSINTYFEQPATTKENLVPYFFTGELLIAQESAENEPVEPVEPDVEPVEPVEPDVEPVEPVEPDVEPEPTEAEQQEDKRRRDEKRSGLESLMKFIIPFLL